MGEHVHSTKKKRRIGVIVDVKPYHGGSYQYVEFILDALVACLERYSIEVVFFDDSWGTILQEKYACFSHKKLKFSYEHTACEVDALGFDYVFMPSYGITYLYEILFKTPLISVMHDLMYYVQPHGKMWTCKESSEFYQMQCQRSIGIFVDSEIGKEHCMEALGHMYEEKLYVLPFRAPNYLYANERKSVNLRNEKYIFYPAQFFLVKNHLNLLLAIYYLRRKGIRVNLLFTGKGQPGYEEVADIISSLQLEQQVEILDYIDGPEMKYLFENARAMIMPSYAGPTNIPPIEAMFMGCPVAVSDIYAMPWQVGNAGLLFDPKSIWDIADVIEKLWLDDDLCKKLSKTGKEQAKRFSKERFNQIFCNSMEQMIRRYEKRFVNMEDLALQCYQYQKVYLYGAGEVGFLVGNYLKNKQIANMCGYVVSSKEDAGENVLGFPVLAFDDIRDELENAFIILSIAERTQPKIQEKLAHVHISGIYPVSEQHKKEAWLYYVGTH